MDESKIAEAFGVAAGVVGVFGFCGQILSGCQYLTQQFEQVKDAPEYIRELKTHLEDLAWTVTTFQEQAQDLIEKHLDIQGDALMSRLTSCLDIVNNLRQFIADEIAKFAGSSKGLWWLRMKTAGKQSKIQKHLKSVDRAIRIV